jgi:hypothetical protein
MNSVATRRAFVGTIAAGLPLLVQNGSFAQSAHNHETVRGKTDPVFEHLAREAAHTLSRAQRRGPRGEDARALAVALRTFAVYGRQVDFDGAIKKAARTAVARQGREQFLYGQPDRRKMHEELRRFDENVRELPEPRSEADYATRTKALDELLAKGASPVFLRAAAEFEAAAADFDRVGGFNLVRWDPQCFVWQQTRDWLEIEAGFMCLLAITNPAAQAACGLLMAALVVYMTFIQVNC